MFLSGFPTDQPKEWTTNDLGGSKQKISQRGRFLPWRMAFEIFYLEKVPLIFFS